MMRKLIIAFGLTVFVSASVLAQTINGTPIKNLDTNYIEIVGTSKLMSTKLTIEIDFGQRDKAFNFKDKVFMDAEGKNVEFNSMIDALNYFTDYGYEYLDAYAVTVGNQNVYHYLLRKKKGLN